ncbi:MAG: M42 family metallopeptidase [Nitrospinota bacterium]|jgi:endoglucanase|nr:M42 family metallopeptidase [Nitrospinota bacterium]
MKERLRAQMKALCALPGVSGFEHEVVRYLTKALEPLVDEVTVDRFGTIYARRSGRSERPRLMYAAHSDQIGFVVKRIEPDGFVRFERMGAILDSLLPARQVRVKGRLGVIGTKPAHVFTAGAVIGPKPAQASSAADAGLSYRDLFIDLGARSADEVKSWGIDVGDPICFEPDLKEMGNGDILCGTAIDNRAACALLVELFRELQGVNLPGTLYGVVTVQEDVVLRGAHIAAYHVDPDLALALDISLTDDTPDLRQGEPQVRMGGGPVVTLVGGSISMPQPGGRVTMTPAVRRVLLETAERHGIPVQVETNYHSAGDAAYFQMVRSGIPAGYFGIAPGRYFHSPVEVIDLNDLVKSMGLLKAIALELDENTNLGFFEDGG